MNRPAYYFFLFSLLLAIGVMAVAEDMQPVGRGLTSGQTRTVLSSDAFVHSGTFAYHKRVSEHATDHNVTWADSNSLLTNSGAAGDVRMVLPLGQYYEGLTVEFKTVASQDIVLVVGANDHIKLSGGALNDAQNARMEASAGEGAWIKVTCDPNGNWLSCGELGSITGE